MNKLAFLFLFLISLFACKAIPAYLEHDSPVWKENKYGFIGSLSSLIVVSYNIEKGEKIFEAIESIKKDSVQNKASILFLQEVDEKAVQKISNAFSFNYVYYPISYHKKQDQNYGNAILSRFEIVNNSKLILPHEKWTNKRRRIATKASIFDGQDTLHLYSVHLETIVMKKSKRLEQIQAMVEDYKLNSPGQKCIIGGDFNTLNKKYLAECVNEFELAGFDWGSENLGSTARALFNSLNPANDHFFITGLEGIKLGKGEPSSISDHVPIWIELIKK